MVAETKIQFISSNNLNAPSLPNSWNVLTNVLDATLVVGLNLPTITSISEDGSVLVITFTSDHRITLGQMIQFIDFVPNEYNRKWRVIGVPTPNQVAIDRVSGIGVITTIGIARLPPLGYEKTFSAIGKAVYRNANVDAEHRPFLRVDDTIDPNWPSTAAKMARVGVLLNCDDIDDIYQTPQLPYDPVKPTKNWLASGSGTSADICWAKWIHNSSDLNANSDLNTSENLNSEWTIVGDETAFYIIVQNTSNASNRQLYGFGVHENYADRSNPYFLASMSFNNISINTTFTAFNNTGTLPFRALRSDNTVNALNCSFVHVMSNEGLTQNANTHFGKIRNGELGGFVMGKQYLTVGGTLIGAAPFLVFPHTSQNINFHLNVRIVNGEIYLFEPVQSRHDTSNAGATYTIGFLIGAL